VPHGRWRTLTFLAALRHDRITAPCVIDGPINGTSFRAYIEQFLVPSLSLATSSSWTISAATKLKPCAAFLLTAGQTELVQGPGAALGRSSGGAAGVLGMFG
jgi:hypothetical protein